MKLVIIALGLLAGLQLVYGECHECEGQASLYEALGCNVTCKKGPCVTKYGCQAILLRYRFYSSLKMCYFENKPYVVGFILLTSYPSLDGLYLCRYICTKVGNYYYFTTNILLCTRVFVLPSPALCRGTLILYGPMILYNNAAVVYTPARCVLEIILFPVEVQEPSNAIDRKHCKWGNRRYAVNTSIRLANGMICICICPPIQICF